MKNAIRRNRNIGTCKQGYGKDNRLTIPQSAIICKSFYEQLDNYKKIKRRINEHEFLFIIEQTRGSSQHACSVNDISKIIENIPSYDYGNLKLIILRQPKRKEKILSPVWGRLVYSYEFESDYYPAIIIEAIDFSSKFKWTKKLSVESQQELARLREDGHLIIDDNRNFVADYYVDNVRATQLYRTLIHEFGHFVHYQEFVERPEIDDEDYEEWEKRYELYFKLSTSEKEQFAHKYADSLKNKLIKDKVIPFERIEDE